MHLSVEELLDVRDGAGTPEASAHAISCAACGAEIARMRSLAAALRALPELEPPSDRWGAIQSGMAVMRRRRRISAGAGVGLALAASLAMLLLLPKEAPVESLPPVAVHEAEVAEVAQLMEQSRRLEEMLRSFEPRGRVTNGLVSIAASDLEYEIGLIDTKLTGDRTFRLSSKEAARLWGQRVNLMNDLVRVRGARPDYVGF